MSATVDSPLAAPCAALLAAGDGTSGKTAAQVARAIDRPIDHVQQILDDEVRRGHLERRGDRFAPSPVFVRRYRLAFALVVA